MTNPDSTNHATQDTKQPDDTEESTQPFDINERTGEPSNRPEHDAARDKVDKELHDGGHTITPEETSGNADS